MLAKYKLSLKNLFGIWNVIIKELDLAITKYKIAVFVDAEYWYAYNFDKIKSGKRVNRNRQYLV